MPEDDPQKLAEALEREAEDLERRSQELQQKVDDARQEWERKRADAGVPGAPPPPAEVPDEDAGSTAPEAPPGSDRG
jgi:hypothetical protein